jgi:hypothetical protein
MVCCHIHKAHMICYLNILFVGGMMVFLFTFSLNNPKNRKVHILKGNMKKIMQIIIYLKLNMEQLT